MRISQIQITVTYRIPFNLMNKKLFLIIDHIYSNRTNFILTFHNPSINTTSIFTISSKI